MKHYEVDINVTEVDDSVGIGTDMNGHTTLSIPKRVEIESFTIELKNVFIDKKITILENVEGESAFDIEIRGQIHKPNNS